MSVQSVATKPKSKTVDPIDVTPEEQSSTSSSSSLEFSSSSVPVSDDHESDDLESDDLELAELENEIDDEPYAYDTGSDLLEDDTIDPKTAEGLELLELEIEGKQLELQTLRADKQAQALLVQLHAEALATFGTLEQVLATERAYDQADEMSDLLATPVVDVDVDVDGDDGVDLSDGVDSLDAEIASLQAELDAMPDEALTSGERYAAMYEEANDKLLDSQERLEDLLAAEAELCETVNALRVKAGILLKSDTGKLSYATKSKAKMAGATAVMTAGMFVEPLEFSGNILAAVSLAKTVKHVLNLKKLKKNTKNPETVSVIDYALKQKTQKAGKKAVETVGGGAAVSAYGVGKAVYKKLKNTKGKARIEQAKKLHALARGDSSSDIAGSQKEASAVLKELVGSSNLTEALTKADGWKIIAEKLRSA